MLARIVLPMFCLACACVVAEAAEPQRSDVGTAKSLTAYTGADVEVAGETSDVVRGILVSVDDTSITLDVKGTLTPFRLAAVSRVARRGDPLKNGILIGMAVGGGWCALVCGQGAAYTSQYITAIAVNGAVGALVGAWIDASRSGTRVIYRRTDRLSVAITPAGRAITIVVRF